MTRTRKALLLGVPAIAAGLVGISYVMSARVLHVEAVQVMNVRVLRADGSPAAGARVEMGYGRHAAATVADPEGQARLELSYGPGCDLHSWPLPDEWTCRARYPEEVWVRAERSGATAGERIPLAGSSRYRAEHDVRLTLAPAAGPR